MIKYPRNWNKLTNPEQREWTAKRLTEKRSEEKELTEMYRRLVLSPVSIMIEERPDVEQLKS